MPDPNLIEQFVAKLRQSVKDQDEENRRDREAMRRETVDAYRRQQPKAVVRDAAVVPVAPAPAAVPAAAPPAPAPAVGPQSLGGVYALSPPRQLAIAKDVGPEVASHFLPNAGPFAAYVSGMNLAGLASDAAKRARDRGDE